MRNLILMKGQEMKRFWGILLVLTAFYPVFAIDEISSVDLTQATKTRDESIENLNKLYEMALNNSFAYQEAGNILEDAKSDVGLSCWEWAPKISGVYQPSWERSQDASKISDDLVSYENSMDGGVRTGVLVEETIFNGLSRIYETKAANATQQAKASAYKASHQEILLALIQLIINLNKSYGEMDYAYWSLDKTINVPVDEQGWMIVDGKKTFSEVDALCYKAKVLLDELKGKEFSVPDKGGRIFIVNKGEKNTTTPDFLDELLSIAENYQKLLTTRNQVVADKIVLLRFIGLSPTDELPDMWDTDLKYAITEPGLKYSFENAVNNNLNLKKAKSELAVANSQRDMLISRFLPSLSASFFWGLDGEALPLVNSVDKHYSNTIGLNLSWEFDTIFTTPLRYSKSSRSVDLANNKIDQIKEDLKAGIETFIKAYKNNYELWHLSELTINMKVAYLRACWENFQDAIKAKKDISSKFSDLVQARNELLNAVRERIQAKVRLLYSWAQLLLANSDLTVENFCGVMSK
jgi:outer membrane protein TolC